MDFSSERGCKIIAKMADFTQHAVFFDLKYVVHQVPGNSYLYDARNSICSSTSIHISFASEWNTRIYFGSRGFTGCNGNAVEIQTRQRNL